MKKQIKVRMADIFDYVVKNSSYDAIEKLIDPNRYEVFDTSIYDHKNKRFLMQSPEYEKYCQEVSKLRKASKGMSTKEIESICLEIEEIAPTSIFLSDD